MTDPVPPGPAVPPGSPGHAAQVGMVAPAYPPPDPYARQGSWLARRTLPVWAAPVALLTCMAGAVGFTLAVDPTDSAAGDPSTCLLKYTTGVVCPGCGGTRAAWFLLHGDLPAAARHHLLFVFAVPLLLYVYAAWAGRRMFGWRLPPFEISPRALGISLGVWGVWSVLRNLPWAPFTWFYV